ncbi:cubilin-like [Watersipora subatra]|uniref:cubilin-like n=1 Tax=Watersipora subatra TaxID=2589382 RepID=UPI00355C2B02
MTYRERRCSVVLFTLICCLQLINVAAAEKRIKRQSTPPEQPRIVTADGHLIFQTGANHNISFKSSSGGSVNIDGTDVKQMSNKVDEQQVKLIQLEGLPDLVRQNDQNLEVLQNDVDTQFQTLNSQVRNNTRQINRLNRTVSNTRPLDRLTNKVNRIQNTLNTVTDKLTTDECEPSPCQNAGTCFDMYDGYRCLCPVNWQGTTCGEDVNECVIYAGTAQGCHTGSTCVNLNGGFRCDCSQGYTGVLCNVRAGSCNEGSNSELCGHGTCVDAGTSHTCICDDGFTKDNASPARCTVDINECEQVDKPCHDDVQCINVPGTYFCGSCQAGFTGNGHQCNDINECLSGNGGCSLNPPVECINTLGSRICGPCPNGYEKGSNEACVWVGICSNDNGGCSPHATCSDNPSLPTRSCRCNPGFSGNGEGPSGCVDISGGSTPSPDVCSPNPCQNGNCFTVTSSNSFTCSCFVGWTGHLCQTDVDECANNVCQNGATCTNTPGNYTCTCPEFLTGRNCETRTYDCGGEFTTQTGSFRFPPANHDAYPHDISCAWRITTVLHKVLNLYFSQFSLETHPNCDYDFLQIHDGSTASAYQIGKYCGNDTTLGLRGKTITTTHNVIYMWFKTDRSVAGQGFAFTWNSSTPICGEDIRNQSSGSIQSPGYPSNYPVNRTCVWTIRVPPGNNIALTFAHLALENHVNCSFDYLELRNGLRETDPIFAKYCSTTNPGHITTDGNELFVKFHSDASLTDTGFLFTWFTDPVPPNSNCGGRLNLTDGIIISPNFPNHYDHNGDCVWVISIPNINAKISLNFTDFDMESSSTCAYDYLEVHDGVDDTAPSFGKLCGTELPGTIISTTNNLYLRLHTDASVSGSGFRAMWTVACGGSFTASTGTITSPYWPSSYPHSKTCTYSLEAQADQVIDVTFSDFGIEASSGSNSCIYDYLVAYDGANATGTPLRKMCGSVVPEQLTSTGSNMLLIFRTDSSVTDLGFRATYEFRDSDTGIDDTVCGGILTNATGTIVSPGHPNFYPHGVDCLWEVRVAEGFQIRLTFDFISIESSTPCNYDYVQVSNNRSDNATGSNLPKADNSQSEKANPTEAAKTNTSVPVQGRYCGGETPPTFTSTGNVLYVRFHTDSSVAHEGFSISYVSFNHSWCGDERRSLPGVITSPNYPSNYPHMRECIWTITAPDNHQIALNITDFALEFHSHCNYDYLEIRNGGTDVSPLISRSCGTNVTSPIFSHSNRLWLKFKTDGSSSARGFRIWYEDAGEGCGADLTGPSGTFLSPNYPTTYNRNAECYWTITVSQGSSIILFMVDFDIENHNTCQYDYVEVIEGLHTGQSIAKLCGSTLPQPVRSQGNTMTVKFRSDSSLGGKGFHAAYSADCQNRVLNYSSGVIESPNFPDSYPHNRNCTWVINAPLGNILSYRFSHFAIENDVFGSACRNDFLEIRDGNNPNANVIQRLCGSELPAPINSTSNSLYISFKSDASLAENGFRMEYVTIVREPGTAGTNDSNVGCGGDLNTPTGSFTSPNYPNPYPHNRECVWRITVPVGNQIKLQLNDVNLEFQSNCTYDYLEVRGGPDATSPSLTKICHDQNKNYIVTSSGNQMYVKFKTDASSSGNGFTANYSAIPGGCGGVFTSPSGAFQSPNHPNEYPHNTNCEWNITVAEFQTVKISFQEFDIEAHGACIYDYVAIFDGLDSNSRMLDKICGQNHTDVSFSSTSNSMRVRFSSDASSAGRGFKASYVTSCGGRITVDNTIGVIRSPNYPDNYQPNTNCTWTLMGSQAVDRITLQFSHMDLEESDVSLGLCAHDSVRVLQGDNADAPQQGIYCGQGVPPSITSTSYALTVVFTTDSTVQLTGFSASYSKSTSFCGGNITATHGAFSTPNYPDIYPRNAECVWYLNAAPGNLIQLSFESFNLEDTAGCARDYVEVRDGVNINNVLGRYCGSTIPNNLTIARNMSVKFRSDDANNFGGFSAQFSTLTGGDLVGNTGQLASPLYPRAYQHNSDFTWTIIVDIGLKVRIEFVDMDIEAGAGCGYDYLQFLDGPAESGPAELLRTCGTELPTPFSSTGNVMTVVFHTDVSAAGRGFLLSWSAVSQVVTTPGTTLVPLTTPAGCNYEIVATESPQNISSPNWPNNYEDRTQCRWTIRAEEGVKIQFVMLEMDIESSSGCVYDALKIYDGESELSSRLLDNKCGRALNQPPVSSSASAMKVVFTTDSSVTRKGFFGQVMTSCGGVLQSTTGVIRSPNHPATYPTNSSCQWLIQVVAGRTIELTVNSFSLPSSSNCTGDRLRILNGGNADSPSIEGDKWAYCGSQTPGNNAVFTSASRYMWVEFTSDSQADSSNMNFQLTYSEKSLTCGGNLVIPDDDSFIGSFTSPGFTAGNYPHNADCTWVITAPANHRIQLDFAAFDLEKHATCAYDYVLIRDGGTENSPQLTRICGSENQPTVRSSSNVISVRLVTDDSVPKGGFNITYKKVTCGGTLIGTAGSISSPQYPNDYPNNADCEWYLEAPVGHYIGMNFTAFSLGSSRLSNCTGQDTLSFSNRDRFGNVTDLIGSFCGSLGPAEVRTADSKAYVRFTSNDVANYPGFSLSFYASVESCGGEMTAPTGVIQSPNYPGYYAHDRQCTWLITAPEGRRVTITFDAFDIEAHSSCAFDYVQILNGHLERSPQLGKFCGNTTAGVVESTGNKILVKFVSDGSISNGGFSLSYTTTEPIVCGGVLTPGPDPAALQHITTPGYNETILPSGNINLTGHYPPNMQCEWKLQTDTSVNTSIVLKFSSNRFKLEHDGECRYDFMRVHEGVSSSGRSVGRYCSNLTNNVPTQVAVPGNQMWIAFVSDATVQHQGFNVSYQFAPCGGVLRSDTGEITSPNYPNPYDHDMGCAWEIQADEGQQIELTVAFLDLEQSPKCEYDHLTLYNGGSHLSPIIKTLCGSTGQGNSYTSATNVMRVEFGADFSQAGNGFRLTYQTKTQGCGGVFNALTGNVSTQNYPNDYPNGVECLWDIIVPSGYHINLQQDPNGPFDIETGDADGSSCYFDYVEFFNVDSNGVATEMGRRYCGHQAPPPQKSDGNHMRIKFRSDRWTTGNGFNFLWTAGCGATYNATSGQLFSPGYPNNYQHNLTCDYIILAEPTQFVVIQFDENNFRIEAGTSCQYDSVTIYEGSVNGTSKGSFCGLTAPQPIATRGQMVVRFKTDGDTSDDGFRATFFISDCGGYLNGTSGEIKSPTHPVDYHNNLNCTWQIEVSANRSVNLRFEEFDVEASNNGACQFDYLAIYDGRSISTSALIGRYCGSALPENVRSINNIVTVVFSTDASITKGGFKAYYMETYGPAQGCGGRRNSSAGIIEPIKGSNGEYLNQLDCVWIITVPDNKVISLQLNNVAIEAGGSTCAFDGLELTDGFSTEDRLLAPTICGSLNNSQYMTATNMMRVRFYTDGSVGGGGFTLNYTSVPPICGGIRSMTGGAGETNISSPGYPNEPSTTPISCRWTIGAPAGKQIRITVYDLAITGDPTCSANFLHLRDQPLITNEGTGQDLQFCNTTTPFVMDSHGDEGFLLSYAIATCNRTYSAMDGRITSPGWPTNYDHRLNCVMRIEVPAQNRIALYYSVFSLEFHPSCNFDHLEIFDGTLSESNSVGKHCGSNIPDPYVSTGNVLTLQMITDGSSALSGFDITYVASPSGCGGQLTAVQGTFSSPNNTGIPIVCQWVLNLPVRRRPTIEFDVMDLRQNNSACPTSHVIVRDGDNANAALLGKFCDGSTPSLTASTNKLFIEFSTDGNLHSEAKFRAQYSSNDAEVQSQRVAHVISDAFSIVG